MAEIKLMEFQQEALKLALKVKNTLMCMKVGSGKSVLSLFYTKYVINKKISDKVVLALTKTAIVPISKDFLEKGGIKLKLIEDFEDYLDFISDNKRKVCMIKHSFFEKIGYNQNNIDEVLIQLKNNPVKLSLIVDEAHKLSNDTGVGHTSFMNCRFMFDKIVLLTATPYSSCLSQLYGVVHLIYPKLWKSKREFFDNHIDERTIIDRFTGRVSRKEKVRYKNLKMLKEKLLPFTFFYYPKVKLNYVDHTTRLTSYEVYDNICMGLLDKKDLEK